MGDWVTAEVLARGDALSRKFVRLRDAADHAMLDSVQFRQWGDFYTLLQERGRWPELLAAAEDEEKAAQQGAVG